MHELAMSWLPLGSSFFVLKDCQYYVIMSLNSNYYHRCFGASSNVTSDMEGIDLLEFKVNNIDLLVEFIFLYTFPLVVNLLNDLNGLYAIEN